METLISIVIVNFNAGQYLSPCLDALEQQSFRNYEVILVDNASTDGSLLVAEQKSWVKIIRNRENRGFAAAQNQGMRLAKGKYLMPLNFDIHLMPDFLTHAVTALDKNPTVGTISGKMLRMYPNGKWTDEFDNAGLLFSQRRKPHHRGQGDHDHGQYQKRELVFGAMGAAAVLRRDMLEDVAFDGQYFDESFFTWYEDVDLDWRARLRGWDCLYVPEAVAYHVGDPQKNHLTPFGVRHSIRNRWQMIIANDCFHCVIRDARSLFIEEFELLRHVVVYRYKLAYLKALIELFGRLPDVLRKRRYVHAIAQRSCLPEYPQPISRRGDV